MKRKTVEGPFGVKMTEDTARKVEALVKELPKDSAYRYRRKGVVPSDTEVQAVERVDVSKVTTRAMDRDFEVVDPAGIDLEQYRLNPIVLFGHDQDRPVGKALWIKPDSDGVVAKTQYISRPENYQGEWLPDFVFSMVQADVLKGKSIGFLPLEVRDPTEEEITQYPELRAVITRSLLLEYSVVSVPSNPAALVESIGKGQGLEHWGYKVVGRVKKPVKPKAKVYQPMAEKLAEVKLDPERVADLAVANLLKRWEV